MKKPKYEIIRDIAVKKLLAWNDDRLKLYEISIKAEKEILEIKLKRAHTALKWLQGVIRIKKSKNNGGRHG